MSPDGAIIYHPLTSCCESDGTVLDLVNILYWVNFGLCKFCVQLSCGAKAE